MLDFKSLEAFYWVCHLENFSAAAEKIHTTQSSISQRVSNLEQYLGYKLLERSSRSVRVTSEGRALLGYAEQFLVLREEIKNRFHVDKDRPTTIRLGVSETIVHTWLTSFVELVSERYPNVELNIMVDQTNVMYKNLTVGELDLCFMLGPVNDNRFMCSPLNSYALTFCCNSDVKNKLDANQQQLANIPVITYPINSYPFSVLKERFKQSEFGIPRIFTSSSLSTMVKFAIDGTGIALLPKSTVTEMIENGQLLPLNLGVFAESLHFYSMYAKSVDDSMLRDLSSLAVQVSRNYQK